MKWRQIKISEIEPGVYDNEEILAELERHQLNQEWREYFNGKTGVLVKGQFGVFARDLERFCLYRKIKIKEVENA